MKYLSRLFAPNDRQSHNQHSPTKLTSTLYSVTFIQESPTRSEAEPASPSSAGFSGGQVSFAAHGDQLESSFQFLSSSSLCPLKRTTTTTATTPPPTGQRRRQQEDIEEEDKLEICACLLKPATVGTKTIASTSAKTLALKDRDPQNQQRSGADDVFALLDYDDDDSDEDWILIDESTPGYDHHECCNSSEKPHQMAMDKADVELIKASWVPVRKDPVASGVLLFKGLFTKFPQYLKMFPAFSGLDLDHMHEHKRLLKHATTVIETVTFVVDSIGDESMKAQLNEALVALVKGHLKRQVGLTEFRNLGIVLIDFICDVNHRRGSGAAQRPDHGPSQLNKLSPSESSSDSETMTSALDKIRASSSPSSSSSDEESYRRNAPVAALANNLANNDVNQFKTMSAETTGAGLSGINVAQSCTKEVNLDTNALVAAWTKLYSGILDIVKREEDEK